MSGLSRRQLLGTVGALAVAGAAGCARSGASAASGTPVRIGLLAPRTGIWRGVGDEMCRGFQLYLANRSNLLGGHRADVVAADEGETEDSGRAAADNLLRAGVIAVCGVASSAVLLAIRDRVQAARTPLISANASPRDITSASFLWRTSCLDNDPGRAIGQYVAQHESGPVVVLASDDPAGRDQVGGFLDTFTEAGGRLAGTPVYVPPGTANLQPAITAAKQSDATAVFGCFAGQDAVTFVSQYHDAGVSLPLYGPGCLTEAPALAAQGAAARGIVTAANYSPDLDNPVNRQFVTRYLQTHGTTPGAYAVAAYDAAAVLDRALNVVGADPTTEKLNTALLKVGRIDSPRGAWLFNRGRTPAQRWYLRQVRADGNALANVLLADLGNLG